MTELPIRSYPVSNNTLDADWIGEPVDPTVPHHVSIDPDDEDAAAPRPKSDFCELILEGGEQLLREPGCARQPMTLGAVLDLSSGLRHVRTISSLL